MVDFGLIETRALRKAGLLASARGYRCVMGYFSTVKRTKTYLVVCSNQLSYGVKSTRSCEFAGTCHRLEVELLLRLLLRQSASLRLLFCFLHGIPNGSRNCPMIHWYACVIAFLLVCIVVLTNMETAGGIPSFVQRLSLPIQFRELFILPAT